MRGASLRGSKMRDTNKSYSNRLKSLNLPTLKYSRHRGDMIELFKIIKGIYDPSCVPHIDLLEFAETQLGLGVISINLLNTTVIMTYGNIISLTVLSP